MSRHSAPLPTLRSRPGKGPATAKLGVGQAQLGRRHPGRGVWCFSLCCGCYCKLVSGGAIWVW